MPDYASLIERVRSGSGADRELDQDLMPLAGYVLEKRGRDRNAWWYPVEGNGRRYSAGTYAFEGCPRYTSSLDAVVRLVEEKLPGWSWQVGPFSKVRAQLAQPVETDFGPGIGLRADETAATPVRALLAALLTAIQAQETS